MNTEGLTEYSSSSLNEFEDWKQVSEKASIYDLIEINRGLYSHWVMYLGNEDIVHVTQVEGRTEGQNAEKRTDKLHYVTREDKCRINNHENAAVSKGLKVRTDEEILESVSDVIDGYDYMVVPYTVLMQNCEHYATSWKYGEGFSVQIQDVIRTQIPPEMLAASLATVNQLDETGQRPGWHLRRGSLK